ncbi:MAG: LPS export ABC transporter periplasmic protein LptC [Syntrophales bacterium]|nr:LPS export ABC transporter periplasmic protein LptC [Syntrophales bacterium]
MVRPWDFQFQWQLVRLRYPILWILVCALAVVATGAVLWRIYFPGDKAARAVLEVVSEAVDLEVKDFRYSQVGDPDFHWEVRADRAWYRKRDEEVHLEEVAVKFISHGGSTYLMTGERGVLHNESGDMEISGNVVVVSGTGEEMKTKTLRYRSLERHVFTDDEVVMNSETMVVSGRGMTFALDGNELVLSSNVKAVINDASLFHNLQ